MSHGQGDKDIIDLHYRSENTQTEISYLHHLEDHNLQFQCPELESDLRYHKQGPLIRPPYCERFRYTQSLLYRTPDGRPPQFRRSHTGRYWRE